MLTTLLAMAVEVGVPAGMGLGGLAMGAWVYKKLSSQGERIAVVETEISVRLKAIDSRLKAIEGKL